MEVVKAGLEAAQAVIVALTRDDIARLRPELGLSAPIYQPRANVIFEAGWAFATLGQERTVLVRFGELQEFSDINGLNSVHIDDSPTQRAALRQRLLDAGCKVDTRSNDYLDPRISGSFAEQNLGPEELSILQRGGFTDLLVDSTLSYSFDHESLQDELIRDLTGGAGRTIKYNYIGSACAINWLELSKDPTYGHNELVEFFRKNLDAIITAADIQDKAVDFVSLGPGDGTIDVAIIDRLQRKALLQHYYPVDLSFELLQTSVRYVLAQDYLLRDRDLMIKAIHGDFSKLSSYKPIFAYNMSVNLLALVGYSLGNHNESDSLGKLLEGMEIGDLLLFDIRLHQLGTAWTLKQLSKEDREAIIAAYNHSLNNRFAFGPIEAATWATFKNIEFGYDVSKKVTTVPFALNVITYCKDIKTRFRRSNSPLNHKKLDLAVTTLYDLDEFKSWLERLDVELVWTKNDKRSAVFLVRKIEP